MRGLLLGCAQNCASLPGAAKCQGVEDTVCWKHGKRWYCGQGRLANPDAWDVLAAMPTRGASAPFQCVSPNGHGAGCRGVDEQGRACDGVAFCDPLGEGRPLVNIRSMENGPQNTRKYYIAAGKKARKCYSVADGSPFWGVMSSHVRGVDKVRNSNLVGKAYRPRVQGAAPSLNTVADHDGNPPARGICPQDGAAFLSQSFQNVILGLSNRRPI